MKNYYMSCDGLTTRRNIIRMYIGNSVLEKLKKDGYEEDKAYKAVLNYLYIIYENDLKKTIDKIYKMCKKDLENKI